MVFRAIRPDWGPEVEERNRIAAVSELGGKERAKTLFWKGESDGLYQMLLVGHIR